MNINSKTHCLEEAIFIASPNCCERPCNSLIDLLVIHNISLPPDVFSGYGITQLFTNQLDPTEHPYYADIHHLRVSSHLVIRRKGEIIQYVPFDQQAYHAGESSFQGRSHCNTFSIGIELEGSDHLPFEFIQYQHLIAVTKALMRNYPAITHKHIVGHSDIAPGRKTDPGPFFNWKLYLNALELPVRSSKKSVVPEFS